MLVLLIAQWHTPPCRRRTAKSGRLEIPELRRFPSLGLFLFTPLARSVAGTISAPIRIARTTAARPPSVIADCGDFEHPGSPGRGARLWT